MVMAFFHSNPGLLIEATNILDRPTLKKKQSRPKFEVTQSVSLQQIEQMHTDKLNRMKSAYTVSAQDLIYV